MYVEEERQMGNNNQEKVFQKIPSVTTIVEISEKNVRVLFIQVDA